jgi:RNAse (barnase) inhibitor barstar
MKSSLGTLLDSGESGLFLLEGTVDASVVELQARARGYQPYQFDCRAVGDKASLMRAAQSAFGLPQYFGENWDALTDCLMDLSWSPGLRWVVLVQGLERLAALDPDSYEVTFSILQEVSDYWADREQPFIVLLLEDCGPEATGLPPVAFV